MQPNVRLVVHLGVHETQQECAFDFDVGTSAEARGERKAEDGAEQARRNPYGAHCEVLRWSV